MPTTQAQIVEPIEVGGSFIEVPPRVASNVAMLEKWDAYIAPKASLSPEDVPLLESWCFWAVIADQCARDLDDDPSPELVKKAEKASTMLMRLGDQLNMSPISRQRAGLISAMTKSTQADIVTKTITSYAQLKQVQDAQE